MSGKIEIIESRIEFLETIHNSVCSLYDSHIEALRVENKVNRKDIDELKTLTRDILNACINVNRSTISIENKLKEVLR